MRIAISTAAVCLLLAGCNRRPGSDDTAGESSGNTTEESESGGDGCDGAALEYRKVCFHPQPTPASAVQHGFEIDGEPGDEIVDVGVGTVEIHKWEASGFMKLGEADAPNETPIIAEVVVGEFDSTPGTDLVVADPGKWARLYHLGSQGELTGMATTELTGPSTSAQGLSNAVAIGPDGEGRWRIVGHFDDSDGFDNGFGIDRLAVWGVNDGSLVDTRIDLPTDACELESCTGGDFNGDGRQDAVCTLLDECNGDVEPDSATIHVLLLATEDGGVDVSVHPANVAIEGPSLSGDVNADARDDLIGKDWIRLGTQDGFGGVQTFSLPAPPTLAWRIAFFGDVDGDSDGELLLREGATGLVLHELGPAPTIEQVQLAGAEFSAARGRFDFNGDSVTDILARDNLVLISEVQP